MDQQRITLFFPVVSRKKTTPAARSHFLNLPFNLRRRIYQEAGLVSGMTISMNGWGIRKQLDLRHRGADDHLSEINFPPLPLSLFAVCRSINDDVSQIFYSENQFIITRRAYKGLRVLERFSNSALSKFRSLIIRLNLTSCISSCCGDTDHDARERRCGNGFSSCSRPSNHDAPLNYTSSSDQLVISQWMKICARFSESIQPGKLSLYITCDCVEHQTADMIIVPLLALPVLENCALRLAREYDEELQNMAKTTVLSLTGRSIVQNVQPFRFLDLPKEIQLTILQHIGLVYSGEGAETVCSQSRMRFGGYCLASGSAHSSFSPHSGLLNSSWNLKCFCRKSHSAFSFSCESCETLGFPLALFLVNRQFREAATEVFYGSNQFALNMLGKEHPSSFAGRADQNLSIVPTLHQFPKHALGFFTSIRLDFSTSNLNLFQPDQPGWKIWLSTMQLLLERVNLAILTLELRLREKCYEAYLDEEFDNGYKDRIWEIYQNFIQPVASLYGLKNFYVYLNWDSTIGFPGVGVLDGREEIEGKLERMVMGEGYDAWKCGKVVRMEGHLRGVY